MNATSLPGFWRPALLLIALTLLLALPQAALMPLLDRDEPRFAEASREMLQTSNFIVPTFNFAPRYAKPPLIYWCQAAVFLVFGENAFAARLPSLLAVAGTALLLLAWGRALGSHATGLIAAFAYAFCLQVMQQGRVATADALLIFFMTLSGFAGWRMLDLVRTGNGSWNLWGGILALGFAGGFLAKGPEALLPIIPIFASARWMGWRGLASFALILALGLLLVAAWAIPAYAQTNGAYWREGLGHDVGDRMVSGFQGHGASTFGWYLFGLPLYFFTFWLSALPWSPLLLLHARRLREAAPLDWTARYLLANAVVVFVIFSLMVTKLPHYTLPAFPFLALLFGRCWIAAGLRPALPVRWSMGFGCVLAVIALVGIPVALAHNESPSPVGVLVKDAGRELTPETRVALVDFREPNAVWEARRVVRAPLDEISGNDAINYLQQPGARAGVLSTALWNKLKSHADPRWKAYEARGFNAARLRKLDLTLVVKRRSRRRPSGSRYRRSFRSPHSQTPFGNALFPDNSVGCSSVRSVSRQINPERERGFADADRQWNCREQLRSQTEFGNEGTRERGNISALSSFRSNSSNGAFSGDGHRLAVPAHSYRIGINSLR